ncbi:phosphopentomutase [Shouchella shacheensis]|uniref:phosphopentomutase n=1 Tax=Shouchella shacheensis TaxID=1649580 RepID=UPI00073FE728|nr:phosphopentomutase [Shouchella shacheensis]
MAKATLLVLDGFGVGAMADCKDVKPEDLSANTYQHLLETTNLQLPTLERLGLRKIAFDDGNAEAAYGRSNLAHYGADTFMGHQELMGSKPGRPMKRQMKEVGPKIKAALETAGYHVTHPKKEAPLLLVDGVVVVGDNLESQLGNIINVTADLVLISFAEACTIARVVRSAVDTSRVIVFGNEQRTSIEQIVAAIEEGHPGQWGVNAPKAEVYGEGYQVLHLGYGVDHQKQFAHIAEQAGVPVYRIGKTADVIQATGYADPEVETKELLPKYKKLYLEAEDNAIFLVNVQETDLAGHKEDGNWYRETLEAVDAFLEDFLPQLGEGDVIIITADHGNDPTIGHSQHTREQTPILVYGPSVRPVSIGTRATMADLAAMLSEFAGVEKPEFGKSFLGEVYGG